MQAEGGQSLSEIIRRKELERGAGDGVFYWGVGNSLGEKCSALVSGEVNKVLFSKMLSAPKKIDVRPDAVAFWLKYRDRAGIVGDVPPHVVVLSRAHSDSGMKKYHFALVCSSRAPLMLGKHGVLNTSNFRNYGSSNPRIGQSQLTTILERHETLTRDFPVPGTVYEINLSADLVKPFFVTLIDPIVLTPAETAELKSFVATAGDSKQYLRKIQYFRKRIAERASIRHA